ncbi:hypothetical protein VTL71DRAFT_653 [Oculimacula yallundae]|uniref:Uncharacterized protein n=1 Tax=Oculimacula yallundae TaxID=86028 RepID=A0ABR4D0T7_9HELO
MFLTKVIGLLALACALVAVVVADGVESVTITMASATALAPLGPGDTLFSFVGNHGPPGAVTRDPVTLSPGLFLTTIPANHAPPGTYTRTSSVLQTITTTTTQTFHSTLTVFGPTNRSQGSTVTSHLSKVSAKPSLVTGVCFWGANGVEIPCTYTAGNKPSAKPTSTGSASGVINSTASSQALSNRDSNPIKRVIDSMKKWSGGMGLGSDFNHVLYEIQAHNLTGTNGSALANFIAHSAAISTRNNPFKFIVDGVKSLSARQEWSPGPHGGATVAINGTAYDTSSEEYQALMHKKNGLHWTKCDHIPVIYSPIAMAVFYIAHAGWIRYKWNEPSIRQAKNGQQVILFIATWGAIFPMFVYIEIYTSIASAWQKCIPDQNHAYAY